MPKRRENSTSPRPPRQRSAPSPTTRARILTAARAHFFRHGFRNVTMDDLAAELGVSKKTLYAHFPSKDALLAAVLQSKYESIRRVLREVTSQRLPHFPDALHALSRGVQNEMNELQPAFLRDMSKAPEIFQRVEQRRAKLIREHFGRLFRQGQRDGHVRTDIPVKLMIETLLGAVQAIMNPQKLEQLELAPRDVFVGLLDLLLHGAGVRK
jgi:AcrR family transcriptional regulator